VTNAIKLDYTSASQLFNAGLPPYSSKSDGITLSEWYRTDAATKNLSEDSIRHVLDETKIMEVKSVRLACSQNFKQVTKKQAVLQVTVASIATNSEKWFYPSCNSVTAEGKICKKGIQSCRRRLDLPCYC